MPHSARRRTTIIGAVGLSAVLAAWSAGTAGATTANDDTQLVTVSPGHLGPWTAQAYDCDQGDDLTPNQGFQNGPGTPPLGQGSHVIHEGTNGNDTELFRSTVLDGTKVADISLLDYSTFADGTSANTSGTRQPGYLRLTVSSDGSSTPDTSLFYEPALNAPDNIVNGSWQTWHTADGTFTTTGGPEGETSLSAFVSDHPDATVVNNNGGAADGGGLALIVGCSGDTQTNGLFGFDRVAINTSGDNPASRLYDFEASQPASGPSDTQVIDEQHPGPWNASAFDYSGNGGAGSTTDVRQGFVFGPSDPPLGLGSRELRVPDNSDATQFWRDTSIDGQRVSDLRRLDYATYSHKDAGAGADLQQPAYLRLSISSDGSGTKDTTLNYEPANNPQVQAVADDVWQTWPTYDGYWRVVEGPGETPDQLITLAGYAARHPDATFATNAKPFGGSGALSLVVGSAGDNQRNGTFNVDDVAVGMDSAAGGAPVIDTTTYDFEPTVTKPTISAPSMVTGTRSVTVTGVADPDAPLVLLARPFGGSFSQVDSGTAAEDGSYTLTDPEITKRTEFVVRAYDSVNSDHVTTQVKVATTFSATSPQVGKIRVHLTTDPVQSGVRVTLRRLNSDGSSTVLATGKTTDAGHWTRWVNAPSGHTWRVFAYVHPEPGNVGARTRTVRVPIR